MNNRHISKPPTHQWQDHHYKHITDTPTFDTHCLDALGTFAGNIQKTINNMTTAYTKALTTTTNTNQTSARQNAQEGNHE
jgi:hypothetical protein